jgi:hypothetical protein
MRAFVQCLLALVGCAAILSVRAIQPPVDEALQPPADEALQPPEDIEEVIVRGGKTLSQWRLEVDRAQDELFALFNELNEGEDNDVRCRNEVPTGSRIPQRVCWSTAQDRASASGARNLLNALTFGAGSAGGPGSVAASAMTRAEIAGRVAEDRFLVEWARVLNRDQEFAAAVAEFAALKADLDALSGASASAQQPRQIVLSGAGPQCEASTYTEYQQLDNRAQVSGTVSISMCPAGTTGSFTLVANVRDAAGAITPVEFRETWQRADTEDHVFNAAYPIGDNVDLVSVRVRNLTCTCEGAAQ